MVLDLLATWIPALLIALSGVMKLTGNAQIHETMRALGVGRYVRWLGVMEVAFAALFVTQATLKVNPFIPIVLLWIGAFIRDRSIFF